MTKQLFKFAGAIVDCYDDPAFVDSVQARAMFGTKLVDPTEVSKLGDDSFAVKIASRSGYKRRFPTYNETATLVSCHYFDRNHDDLPEEICKSAGKGLSEACDHFGMTKSATVAQYSDEDVSRTVELVTKKAGYPTINQDTLHHDVEMRLAFELPKMPVHNRTFAATSLYKTAGAENITRQDVYDYVEKPVVGPKLEGALDDRASLLRDQGFEKQAMFDQLRSDLDDMEAADIVAALVTFDKYAGFDQRYAQGFIDPYIAVYGGWSTPSVQKRNYNLSVTKEAEVVDGATGSPVSPEAAKGLSVEQHLFNLQKRYPKNTDSFNKAASAGVTSNMEKNWGTNYIKARKLYFGV